MEALLNFLTWVYILFPLPVASLIFSLMFVGCGIAFYILLLYLLQFPQLNFLLIDMDEVIARWLTPKPKKSKRKFVVRGDEDLQLRLLHLLKNDTATARRLIQHQRKLHPKKSQRWILEKVIWDLERDRT